nr:hypothetical protein [Tanacetum cinerariifolium]
KKTLDKENVSKQERDESNRTEELNLSDKGSGETKVFDYTTVTEKDVNAAKPVSTTGDVVNATSVILDVSATGPSTSTAEDIFKDEMATMTDTVMVIRRTRPRTTSVVIHDVEEEPRRATPPPTVQSQDKEKLQQEEREQFTVDEQARMLVERKRFFTAQRAEQIRNNPPTKAQLKNKMVTYLKHMEGSKKRSRVDHDKESVKKQKLEEGDAEKEELRACLDIVLVDNIAMMLNHWLPNVQ